MQGLVTSSKTTFYLLKEKNVGAIFNRGSNTKIHFQIAEMAMHFLSAIEGFVALVIYLN